jgi:uncharacterized protein involved in exopolysaccharide biosynthesis
MSKKSLVSGSTLVAVVRTRGVLLLVASAGCVAAALAYALLAPDQYRAVATLYFEPGPIDASSAAGSVPPARSTDADLLRSERVALRVVENEQLVQEPSLRTLYLQSIDAGRQPQEALAQYLGQHVEVSAGGDGALVRLAVTLDDPALATRVANAYAQAWGEVALELRAASIRSGIERANQDLASLRARLGEARARHADNGALAAADSRGDEQFAQLSRLVSQPLAQQASASAASNGVAPMSVEAGRGIAPGLPAEASMDVPIAPADRAADALVQHPASTPVSASSAEDEIRMAQQSLERAEDRMARLSAEGIGAPFPAHVLHPAAVPGASVKPSVVICLAIGLAVGTLLGTILMGVAERLDKRVRRPADLTRATGLVVLGSLPAASGGLSTAALSAAAQGRRLGLRGDAA